MGLRVSSGASSAVAMESHDAGMLTSMERDKLRLQLADVVAELRRLVAGADERIREIAEMIDGPPAQVSLGDRRAVGPLDARLRVGSRAAV